ncbi:DUF6064 family protein [Pelagibius marinus]|uniref:DUF6064 family protein n=1 Tax=Pelagibius marinus TaxID=2762760 RepID=UPI00187303CD|nr:DUF6064 family protein [Pelagibius marinus]
MFPYDAEVLALTYAQYNAAVWPGQPVALLLALAALGLAAWPRRGGARIIGAILVGFWLWCGLVFFLRHMAPLDFMASVYGWVFIAQAALLAWALVWRGAAFRFRPEAASGAALALAAAALFGLPALSVFGAAGWGGAHIVGLTPGPTVLFTLALLLLAEGRGRWLLMVVPLAWCALAGATAWALAVPEAWPLPLLGALALVLTLWRPRRAG